VELTGTTYVLSPELQEVWANISFAQYRIDGVEEYHNPTEPSTTSCPFLPGQTLNILDVPRQIQQPNSKSRSESIILEAAVHTLDPDDRYLNPRPPPTPPVMRPKLPKLITPAGMSTLLRKASVRKSSVLSIQVLTMLSSGPNQSSIIYSRPPLDGGRSIDERGPREDVSKSQT
jgi:hypothetical protein